MSGEQDKTRAVDKDTLESIRRAAKERRADAQGESAVEDLDSSAAVGTPSTDRTEPADRQPETSTTRRREAAQEFVRRKAEDAPEAVATDEKSTRKSSTPVLLALILGGWIVAGGVFVALRTIGSESMEVSDEIALETQADTEVDLVTPVPSATPLPTPTSDALATPTPVPPTPEWLPVSDGPRSAPFTFIVEAIVAEPDFFDSKEGVPIAPDAQGNPLPLANPTSSGAPLVLRVVSGEPGSTWAQVALPGTNEIAWIQAEQFSWNSTNRLLQIDIATNTLKVFEDNDAKLEITVGTGDRSRFTPQASTFVLENASRFGDLEGSGLLRLAVFGENAGPDLDGLPTLSVRITDDYSLLGTYASDGDILVARSDAAELAKLVIPGTKVELIGSPPPPEPTPTPIPTPDFSPPPAASSGGGFVGCPVDAIGTPPNCYRVLERPRVKGSCPSPQVELNGECLLLGGSPGTGPDGGCPVGAPDKIDEFCYRRLGPVPDVPGDCPTGSTDVDGECRAPA